jgi:hypothetical protein
MILNYVAEVVGYNYRLCRRTLISVGLTCRRLYRESRKPLYRVILAGWYTTRTGIQVHTGLDLGNLASNPIVDNYKPPLTQLSL